VGAIGTLVMSELRLIEQAFPWIKWSEPIEVQRAEDGLVRYGCRICIMRHGLRGDEIEHLWKTGEEVEAHIRTKHGEG
jgi:hypothetical protein